MVIAGKMTDRDASGKFIAGHAASNPNGRAPKEREERYYQITMNACTFADWEAIVEKARDQAKKGDAVARKWLSDFLVGVPKQRVDLTSDDQPLRLLVTYADDTRSKDSPT